MSLLLLVAVIGMGLAAVGELWSRSAQREKERELLFVGNQFRQAIALFYHRSPGGAKRYPQTLEELLEDKRYPNAQRYLRRIYADPLTGRSEWGIVKAPEGGIMGVHSLASGAPLKTGNFRPADRAFNDATSYAEWKFVYVPTS